MGLKVGVIGVGGISRAHLITYSNSDRENLTKLS